MKQPCEINCPERSATCHAECEKYIAFSADKIAKKGSGRDMTISFYLIDKSRKIRRRSRRKR